MKTILFILAMLVVSAHAAEELTPEIIAKRQIEAMRALDWAQVANHTHPKALAQVKALFLPIATAGTGAAENSTGGLMMRTLFAGKSVDVLKAESGAAFFQTVMSGIAAVVPDFKLSMSGMQAEIIGHVDEGATTAHVVYRLTRPAGDGMNTKIAVTTVERDGITWKALLNSDLETVARAITARLQTR